MRNIGLHLSLAVLLPVLAGCVHGPTARQPSPTVRVAGAQSWSSNEAQAKALARAGDNLFALGRWYEAARLYLRAANLWKNQKRTDGWVRHTLNAAQAALRAGRPSTAKKFLQRVQDVEVSSALARRRAMINVLHACVDGNERNALPPVRRLLREAEAAEDHRFVERYAPLEKTLVSRLASRRTGLQEKGANTK